MTMRWELGADPAAPSSANPSLRALPLEQAVQAVLWAIRTHESGSPGGNYRMLARGFNPPRGEVVTGPDGQRWTYSSSRSQGNVVTASGAYQFLKGTWASLGNAVPEVRRYTYAFQAPAAVQDAAARAYLLDRWRSSAYGNDWDRVILGHFFPAAGMIGGRWNGVLVGDKARWDSLRPPGPASNPTFGAYLRRVLTYIPSGVRYASAAAEVRPPDPFQLPPAPVVVAGVTGSVRPPAAALTPWQQLMAFFGRLKSGSK